ncbi:Poly [ADP-ribose] polymerase 1 [Orchesella cincta]|uniref:Poly [ADP-ribose] polymerase n=1 Tax=Orchesella cincta TaxID=48709 RepID=A0A1D2MJL0_ORCCI|nr:Poly [ADP-ribose] polymerase 1 [Orchesella cincta]
MSAIPTVTGVFGSVPPHSQPAVATPATLPLQGTALLGVGTPPPSPPVTKKADPKSGRSAGSTPGKSRAVTPPPPSIPTVTSGRKRRRPNGQIDPTAVDILIELPGIKKRNIRSHFFVARHVTESDPMHANILTYINNGQRHSYGIEVMDIVRVIRDEDNVEFDQDPNFNNQFRMLLWHGTTDDAVSSILMDGFKPPDLNGQMFGTGIYFADRASKSTNYCTFPHTIHQKAGEIRYLLLCDVLLGKTYNARYSHNNFTEPPTATTRSGETLYFDSVKCTGEYIPDEQENVFCKGSLMPIGKTVDNTTFQTYSVVHNEYVVYSGDKVKPKYLVKIKFCSSPITN